MPARRADPERIIAVGRAEEALRRLAECESGCDDEPVISLGITVREQLGGKEEAQAAAHWACFEAMPGPEHPPMYLQRLPG
jgi:hypothetical protein